MSAKNEFFEAYRWLREALEPHCDEVIMEASDFDRAFAVCARWGEGDNRIRVAVRVEYEYHEGGEWISAPPEEDGYATGDWEGGEWKHHSLNKHIADGKITREQVIKSFAEKRLEWWEKLT